MTRQCDSQRTVAGWTRGGTTCFVKLFFKQPREAKFELGLCRPALFLEDEK